MKHGENFVVHSEYKVVNLVRNNKSLSVVFSYLEVLVLVVLKGKLRLFNGLV